MDYDIDIFTVTGHRFVYRVIDGFIDEMMKPALGNIAYVHRRPFADRFQTFKYLYLVRAVFCSYFFHII
jgi:hypothetical protein